jgi:hypothetical protein
VRISLNINHQPITAGDDIAIVIHPETWEIFSTMYYKIETVTPDTTIAGVVSPFNLEYDWIVDVVGTAVVFKVSAFPIFHSAFSDPVLIVPLPPDIVAPEDGELLHAGSPYTFRWNQTPPAPPNYRLRFSTDDAQTFPELGNDIPGTTDHVTRNVPASPTDQGLVRLEALFLGFDPIFNEPIHVTTTDKIVLHVGTPPPWHVGENGTVNWEVAGDVDHYKVELSRNGGQSWTTIGANVPGNQHHLTIGVDPPVSNSCRVRVEAFGPSGSATAMSGPFHIVGGPPHRGGRNPRD